MAPCSVRVGMAERRPPQRINDIPEYEIHPLIIGSVGVIAPILSEMQEFCCDSNSIEEFESSDGLQCRILLVTAKHLSILCSETEDAAGKGWRVHADQFPVDFA